MKALRRLPATRVAILALVLGVTAFTAGAVSRSAPGTPKEPTPLVLPLQPSEVRRVVVESGERQVELTRAHDGSWSRASEAPSQSPTLMFGFEERLFPLRAYRTLAVDTSEPAYGLVHPEMEFRVEDARGDERSVLLGAPTFTGGGFYARRGDQAGRVYLVPRRMMDDLRSLLAGQRVDAPNEVPGRFREADEKATAEAEKAKVNWWLQQVLDAGTPLHKGLE